MLTPELAEKIIAEVRKFLNEDIIVVNTEGIIIASTDENRKGQFHEGAKITSEDRDKLIITKEKQARLQGVKPGINLPVFFKQEVIGVIGITGDPTKVSPFGEIIRKMTELLISEAHFAEQTDWHSRALEGFLFDWLQENEWDSSFIERAKLLDINLDIPRQIVIAKLSQQDNFVNRVVWSHLFSWTEKRQQDFIIRWGSDRVIALFDATSHSSSSISRTKIKQFVDYLGYILRLPVSAGVGKVVAPSNLITSYRQAERALRATKNQVKLLFDEDLTLEMIIDDLSLETKSEFLAKTIEPLTDKELLETLIELFKQNHSLKKTAEALHIHINTLHYRLKKINEITGFNTSNIQELLILYLALCISEEKN